MKQKNYIAGLYFRLSQEDERQGESISIENQRMILRKYALEHGFIIHDEYIDDGFSGTTFERPGVQRLLDDAKNGVINTIIVKDMSRFGRNYIEIGQYTDYVFPAFGIRFIAIQDNVDSENKNSNSMEMLPIVNVFNEWHAANTSKKIRAVRKNLALEGKRSGARVPYGYLQGTDEKRTLQLDEETAPTIKRIFELYAAGNNPPKIADILNMEGIPTACRLAFLRTGKTWKNHDKFYWEATSVSRILGNIVYLGHLAQQKYTTVSYKNHKIIEKDPSEWVITYNAHPAIISQELWDKVQERKKSRRPGRKMHTGVMHPLSGYLYCADCGGSMKMGYSWKNKEGSFAYYNFDCGRHKRYGKAYCFSHFISTKELEEIILADIRGMAQKIVLNEKSIREEFIKNNEKLADESIKNSKKELQSKQKRVEELDRIIQNIYEDKVNGKMEEKTCFSFIEKYTAEQNTLYAEIDVLKGKVSQTENYQKNVENFMQNLKKYYDAQELTRAMVCELIDRVIIGGFPQVTGKDREIQIVYKVDFVSAFRHRLIKK